jgi:IS5 family transposase
VQGDEAAVFMDKAYDSAPRREALAEAGIADGIMHRGHARRPLGLSGIPCVTGRLNDTVRPWPG